MTAERGDRPTAFSYAAAAASGALVVLLVGYLAFDALRAKTPPRLTAVVVSAEVRRDGGQAYVPVEVVNEGDLAAAQVVVETGPEGVAGSTQTAIDYLAGGERRRIVAILPASPDAAFRARVVSYQEP